MSHKRNPMGRIQRVVSRFMVAFLVVGLLATCLILTLFAPVKITYAATTCFPAADPVQNGTIAANEYGDHTDGQNQQTTNAGNTVWYVTWNDTNLFIGLSGANLSEDAVFYLDKDPQAPINSSSGGTGGFTGFSYDRTTINLPIKADFVAYFKDGYNEYRTNSSGAWSSQQTTGLTYGSSGNVREIAIPWAAITGGTRPASFAWLGYIGYDYGASNTGVYATVPAANPGGAFNQAATTKYYERYYIVNDTSSAGCTPPFNHDSFVFNNSANESNVGQITVWDFTMNTTSQTISRKSISGNDWTINHNLRVDSGTVDFNGTASATSVSGDVLVNSGGTLKISKGGAGGDISIGGNFTNNGIFSTVFGTVTFNGSTAQTIGGSSSTQFYNLTTNNGAGGSVAVTSIISIANNLTITAGTFTASSTNISISANLINNGTFTANSGTITFQGSPSTISGSSTTTFNNLIVGTGHTLSGPAILNLTGSFTDNGTFTAGTGSTLNVGGDFINNGTFTPSTGTVVFNGTGVQNLTLNTVTTFKNLTISSGVTLTESVAATNATINGTLTNNGTIEKTRSPISNTTYSFGLTGASITVTNTGSLTSITLDRIDANNPTAPTAIQTGRYWNMSTNGNLGYGSVTLPLGSVQPAQASVCHQVTPGDTSWVCQTTSTTSSTVTANGQPITDPPTPLAFAVGNSAPNGISGLSLGTTKLDFQNVTGSSSQNLTLLANAVQTDWQAQVSYGAGASDWLSLSQKSGTLLGGNQGQVKVTANAKNLAVGTYHAAITFVANGDAAHSVTVEVGLTVNPAYTYYLPTLANNAGGFTSNVLVQNLGSGPANITSQSYDSQGGSTTQSVACSNLAVQAKCSPTNAFANGAKGAGIITSNQPLSIIVTQATPYGASAYTVGTGTFSSLIAPLAINNAAGFVTELTIFNAEATATQLTVNFYDQNGALIVAATKTLNIAAHTSQTLDQTATDSSLARGFYGWAQIIGADGSMLVAQVLEHNAAIHFVALANAQNSYQSAVGSNQSKRDGQAQLQNSSTDNCLFAPAIFNGAFGGFVTGANILNPNTNPVNVSITYYDSEGKGFAAAPFTLAAHAVVPIFQGSVGGIGLPDGGLPSGFYGSAMVTSTGGKVAMVVNEAGGSVANGAARSGVYTAVALVGASPYNNIGLPIVANNGNGLISGATILNTADTVVNGTIAYYNPDGTGVGNLRPFQIAAHASLPIYQGAAGLPSGFVGQAIITQTSTGVANSLLVTTNVQSDNLFYSYVEPGN